MKKILYSIFKKPWPYWVGGLLLGSINIVLIFFYDRAFKISSGIYYSIGFAIRKLGYDLSKISFFNYESNHIPNEATFIDNYYSFLVVGLVLGAMIASLMSSEWRIRKFRKKQLPYSLIGGVLMGYGARIAMGCNIGAYFSAIPSFSLHGWIFGISIALGSYLGIKILLKFML